MRVSIGDVRLFIEVFGQEWAFTGLRVERRPVLIGLHGGPGLDGTGLRYWLAPLAQVSQVIVPDQRGHGRSDAGAPETWTLPTWAADIRGLCEVLDIQRPVVLGNSFGGIVAQQYVISYPDNIAGLILISTTARLPAPEEVIARVREIGGDEAAEAMRRDIENPTDETAAEVKRLCSPLYSRRATPDPVFASLEEYFIRTPELIPHWFSEAQRTIDLRRDLQVVRCPTLVRLSPSEHRQVMPQDEQFDVLGELTAPAPDQQPQHSREGEIGERKQHPAILPSHPESRRSRVRRQSVAQSSPNLVFARARETEIEPRNEALAPRSPNRHFETPQVETDMDTFFALATGELVPRDARESGRACVDGDPAALERCFRVLSLAPRVSIAA